MNPTLEPIQEIEAKPERWGDQFNFNELFRVKGHKGLFTLVSKPNKAGMVGVMGLMSFQTKLSTPVHSLERLSDFVFYTEAGYDNLSMNDVFSNLHEAEPIENKTEKELMEMAVPNYDEWLFKPHHLFKKVLLWYEELKYVMNEIKKYETERIESTDAEPNH